MPGGEQDERKTARQSSPQWIHTSAWSYPTKELEIRGQFLEAVEFAGVSPRMEGGGRVILLNLESTEGACAERTLRTRSLKESYRVKLFSLVHYSAGVIWVGIDDDKHRSLEDVKPSLSELT